MSTFPVWLWWLASFSAGGMSPMGSRSRRWLNQSTYSRVAYSTWSRLRRGRRIRSVGPGDVCGNGHYLSIHRDLTDEHGNRSVKPELTQAGSISERNIRSRAGGLPHPHPPSPLFPRQRSDQARSDSPWLLAAHPPLRVRPEHSPGGAVAIGIRKLGPGTRRDCFPIMRLPGQTPDLPCVDAHWIRGSSLIEAERSAAGAGASPCRLPCARSPWRLRGEPGRSSRRSGATVPPPGTTPPWPPSRCC